MNEARSSNCSFIDASRGGTLLAAELRAKDHRRREKAALDDDSDHSTHKKQSKTQAEGEWFVDAEEDEELMDIMLQKHGFGTFLVFEM
jgi:hypothetical protein